MKPFRRSNAPKPAWRARRAAVSLAGIVAAACLWSGSAHAQFNPFILRTGPRLTKADIDQGVQAAGKLLRTDEAKVGTSETWADPASGNGGSFTIQKAFERRGMTCRTLRSVVDYKAGSKRTWLLNACRVRSGDWKLIG